MTPHHLHATANAWALHSTLAILETLAMDAVADAIAGNRGNHDIAIPSQVFGSRRSLGGHGDPTATLALGAWAPGGPNPDAQLLGDLLRQLDQAAAHLPGAPGMDPLTRIRQAIPAMRPHVAARTAQALQHLDSHARKRLGLPSDLTPLAGNPACPACQLQMLQAHTADPARTVVCTADCTCTGDNCPCGMRVREAGVQHIWPGDHIAIRPAA